MDRLTGSDDDDDDDESTGIIEIEINLHLTSIYVKRVVKLCDSGDVFSTIFRNTTALTCFTEDEKSCFVVC